MTSHHNVPAVVAGVAVAAVAAGAAAYVMNHTTMRQRKRAVKHATAKMSEFMNAMVDGAAHTFMG